MPPTGLDNLKHIVVLMKENRSFDHMQGALMKKYPKLTASPEMNPIPTLTARP
jgi:phospholipase C